MFSKTLFVSLALLSSLVAPILAHGTITGVSGANGVQAAGYVIYAQIVLSSIDSSFLFICRFGIIASTPRNGALPKPFEQDTSVIRDNEIQAGTTGVCGRTKAGGNNDVATQLASQYLPFFVIPCLR